LTSYCRSVRDVRRLRKISLSTASRLTFGVPPVVLCLTFHVPRADPRRGLGLASPPEQRAVHAYGGLLVAGALEDQREQVTLRVSQRGKIVHYFLDVGV
jgi:hypothetical protein